jgi:hypothetical protein
MVWYSIIYSPWTWGILLAVYVLAYGMVRSTGLSKLPLFGNKNLMIIVAIVGLLFTMGFLGSIVGGTVGASSSFGITRLDVTQAFTTGAGGTIAVDSNTPNLINVRLTDAQSNETTGINEVNGTGIITVTRSGDLKAASVPITCTSTDYFKNEVTGQTSASAYSILEKNNLGLKACYIKIGGVATSSDVRESNTLAFAEGVSTGTFGVMMDVDEESHDALTQYSYRDVTVNVGEQKYTFRIWRMD